MPGCEPGGMGSIPIGHPAAPLPASLSLFPLFSVH